MVVLLLTIQMGELEVVEHLHLVMGAAVDTLPKIVLPVMGAQALVVEAEVYTVLIKQVVLAVVDSYDY